MFKNLHILIIDDDQADRLLFTELLSQVKGIEYTFAEASTGEEALTLYSKNKSDCVLLDFMMQDMTGIEFLEILHKKRLPILPTVFLSGHLSPILINKAKDLGVNVNLEKTNLTPEALSNAIASTMEKNLGAA